MFATAITPSGPIHVGNMREVLTTEAIFRSARKAGADAGLLYIADDYDPLRKVYPFLEGHPTIDYAQHVGKPLKEIPCPCGEHPDYAVHFLEPFLQNLEELGIRPQVLSAYRMYGEGQYAEHTLTALDRIDEVRAIIEEVTGRRLPKTWAPFNAQCPVCRRIAGTEVLDYVRPILHCRCSACAGDTDDPEAGTFEVDASRGGGGKLPWRVDWPARWDFLGVTFEAFGKDHGAAGGSWDSGVRLVQEVFGGRPPQHVMYEFLHLKGKGAMHSSTGLAVSAQEILRMTPPEVLRYLLVRQSPRKHIDFDPGLGLLQLVDDFDRHEGVYFGDENPGDITEVERVYELSCPRALPQTRPQSIGYRQLVTIVQLAEDMEGVEAVLRRSGTLTGKLSPLARQRLQGRVEHVCYWLEHFAPDSVRFFVQEAPPSGLEPAERRYLNALREALATVAWDAGNIHDAIHETAKAANLPQGQAFRAVYRAILDKDRGPRAGFFVASLERAWVLERFRAVHATA